MSFSQAEHASAEVDPFFNASAMVPLFWRARFSAASPHWHHVPLLFWFAHATRPTRAVVLGVGDGVAFFALCQALDKLRISGRCVGIGFWADAKIPNSLPMVPSDIRNHSDQFYEDIADLHDCVASTTPLEEIAANSVDLLLVDLLSLPDGEKPASEDLRRVLTPNGTLIVIGGRHPQAQDCVSLIRELKAIDDNPKIDFEAGSGLIITFGAAGPHPELTALLPLQTDGFIPNAIDIVFRRLGQGLADSIQHTVTDALVPSLRKSLDHSECVRRESEKAFLDLKESSEARNRVLWNSQAALFDAQRTLALVSEEKERVKRELEEARRTADVQSSDDLVRIRNEVVAKSKELEKLNKRAADHNERAEAEAYRLRSDLNARFRELAILTSELEKQRAEIKTLTSKLTQRSADIETQKARVEKLKSSLSWRITSPIRAIGSRRA